MSYISLHSHAFLFYNISHRHYGTTFDVDNCFEVSTSCTTPASSISPPKKLHEPS